MRLATYNVEWFANLFDDADRLVVDDGWSGRQDVTRAQQIEALGKVFTAHRRRRGDGDRSAQYRS